MFKPKSTTGIGSLPHHDPSEAVSLILKGFDIPFWPQLPRRSVLEGMIAQFTEGMPQIRILEDDSVIANRDSEEELQRFYESYTDTTSLAISEDYAMGLHEFLRQTRKKRFPFLKGQVTGPITFTLGIRTAEGTPIYFDEELREISLMVLKAKARWQIQAMKPQSDQVLIFIDEPILSVIGGSAYLSINPEEVKRLLKEMVHSISLAGAIPGIHCCGRADWQLVCKSGVKLLSFDSYEHFPSILASAEVLKEFLKNGGYLVWGAIPTTETILIEDMNSILKKFRDSVESLAGFIPEDMIKKQMLLSPSCGMGSRSIEEAHRIIQFLIRLKEEFPE